MHTLKNTYLFIYQIVATIIQEKPFGTVIFIPSIFVLLQQSKY